MTEETGIASSGLTSEGLIGGRVRISCDGPHRLTGRELEVLNWVGEGKRDAEIAIVLGVSVRTVQKHVQRILSKCCVKTRTAAVRHATRAGLLSDDPSSGRADS